MNSYDDIKDKRCPQSLGKMTAEDRAAQFAPFAALTSFGALINETARLTDRRPVLDAETQELLNQRIHYIKENIRSRPEVEVTVFVPDKHKEGGSIETVSGKVRVIDEVNRELIFEDKRKIELGEIIYIII